MTTHSVNKKRRNPAECIVLGMLARGPAHGYDLFARLTGELGPVWRMGQSQVYALLGRLERDGLVRHRRVGQSTRPDRKRYSLTPAGRKLYRQWAHTPVTRVRDLRLEFLGKLHFALQEGRGAQRDLVLKQMELLQERERKLARPAVGETDIASHAREYRLAVVRASIRWLGGLRKKVGA